MTLLVLGTMTRIEDANNLPLAAYRARFLPASLQLIPAKASAPSPYHITLESSSTISAKDCDECFNLIASTSANAYAASSIGWSPTKKRKEMKLPDLRYLLLVDRGVQPAHGRVEGFLSFMLTYEDGHEVVYCYELHLASRLQRQGLGKHLMSLMEHVGNNAGVEKSMLTIFVGNGAAMRFYEQLGYSEDEYSPEPRKMRNGTIKMPTYKILSKSLQEWVTDGKVEDNG
ncbi:MAG: hypothetical protein LQ338_006681 [Usnochroma carphineum]|nr:MAG: hypothetical protein LQ338_006681 [Usnochroma carphineum]